MLEIDIDSIVLDGLTQSEGRRAARAFEAHLGDILMRRGMPEGIGAEDIASINFGQLPMTATSPERIGRALAEALYAELAR